MVRIPNIKIPSVRVGSIVPTSNIGTGGATPAPPTPITYLTQWKIVGNSQVHGDEIWSCGDYNATDGKYHILVQPQGGSIADIALDEPLRKVNDVADTIEFPSDTEGKALVTRNFANTDLGNFNWIVRSTIQADIFQYSTQLNIVVLQNCIGSLTGIEIATALCPKYNVVAPNSTYRNIKGIGIFDSSNVASGQIVIYDSDINTLSANAFKNYIQGIELIYQITPITELVDAPQIQEAESYSMVISQGGKAVSWSDFLYYSGYLLTDNENNLLVDSENYKLTVQS